MRVRYEGKHAKDCTHFGWFLSGLRGPFEWRDKLGRRNGATTKFLMFRCDSTGPCERVMLVAEADVIAAAEAAS